MKNLESRLERLERPLIQESKNVWVDWTGALTDASNFVVAFPAKAEVGSPLTTPEEFKLWIRT